MNAIIFKTNLPHKNTSQILPIYHQQKNFSRKDHDDVIITVKLTFG